jgi:hypothetical protein
MVVRDNINGKLAMLKRRHTGDIHNLGGRQGV